MGMIFITAQKSGGVSEIMKTASVVFIIVFTLVIVLLVVLTGRKTKSMRYAFARNAMGEMYIFDYDSPVMMKLTNAKLASGTNDAGKIVSYAVNNVKAASRIDMINRMGLIEKIIEKDKIKFFGLKIVSVSSIKEIAGAYNVKSEVINRKGSKHLTFSFLKHMKMLRN